VTLSATAGKSRILPSFWARQKIDDLMSQDWAGLQNGTMKPAVQQEITQLGLDYRLMTQFTSFVAVEERVVTKDGKPQRVEVPVEMPDGVSYEGVFGDENDKRSFAVVGGGGLSRQARISNGYTLSSPTAIPQKSRSMLVGTGAGGGVGSGSSGGVGASIAPPPPPASIGTMMEAESAVPTKHDDKPTAERALLESKLSPALLAAFDCWKKSGTSCARVKAGNVELQLFLTEDSAAVIDKLKALGLTIRESRTKGKVLVGNLPVGKLEELAKMAPVRFVALVRPT
jgi:hypothetical protein